jgi:flagellar biosynthesis chaperone FliJ
MPTLKIGGVSVLYGSFSELGKAVEKAIVTVDSRMKKVDDERKSLRRQRRALKAFLGGREKKTGAEAGGASAGVHS